MEIKERKYDLSLTERKQILKNKYICIDTETTGLDYKHDKLCTIQLFCEDFATIIHYDNNVSYNNLIYIFESDDIIKVFHNAVFDVCFLMENFHMDFFGKIVCTKIASKIVNGLKYDNTLKNLLEKYLNIEIDKTERMSDWSMKDLTDNQKKYAINDVIYLYDLWQILYEKIKSIDQEDLAYSCFNFIPNYKKTLDLGIENIFKY